MSDTAPQDTQVPPANTPSPDQAPEPTEERTVPLSSLKAERDKRQALEARLKAIEEANAEAERKRAEEEGRYRDLYEDLKAKHDEQAGTLSTLQERETARIEALQTSNADRILNLADNLRDLVPPGLDPEATAAHLDRLEKLDTTPPPPGMPPGGRTNGAPANARELPPDVATWVESSAPHLKGLSPATVIKHFNKYGPGKGA